LLNFKQLAERHQHQVTASAQRADPVTAKSNVAGQRMP
jgi:hypothetical protein